MLMSGSSSIPDPQLVHDAKYGDNPCTAQELCFRVMQQSAASGQNFLANYEADFYLLLVLPPDWSAFYLLPVLRPV